MKRKDWNLPRLSAGLLSINLVMQGFGCGKTGVSPTDRSVKLKPDCSSEPKPSIDKKTAIELALKNYEQVFGRLASQGEVPGEWAPLESPDGDQFEVKQTATTWELVHDANVGLVAHAKVDKVSGLVEWSLVAYAYE